MHGVACRCLVIPEATAWLYAPLPNFSIEQWRMMVIVAGYTLFVTSQYDIIFTFANQRSGEVYWHIMHIILHTLSFLVVVQCVTVMNINYYQRSNLGDRSKTQHSKTTTEQFITAKVSGNALKQGAEHTQCYVSAVHNCKNMRMRIKTVTSYILNATTGMFTTAKTSGCANVSPNSSRAEKVCGWDGGHPGLTVWNLLNYTKIENAHKVRMKTFVFHYGLLYVQRLGGQKRYGLV